MLTIVTILFIILKLTGIMDFGWIFIFLPEIIFIICYF